MPRKPRAPRAPRDSRSYGELLKDPRWQRKRLEILERDGWVCHSCCEDTKTLHVHHRRYVYGRAPWEYDADDLVTYCCDCHDRVTKETASLKEEMRHLEIGQAAFLAGVAIGIRFRYHFAATEDGPILSPWARESVSVPDYNSAMGIAVTLGVSADDVLRLVPESNKLFLPDLLVLCTKELPRGFE